MVNKDVYIIQFTNVMPLSAKECPGLFIGERPTSKTEGPKIEAESRERGGVL